MLQLPHPTLLVFLLTILTAPSDATDNNGGCQRRGTWRCGDRLISECDKCKCGDDTFSYKDYWNNDKKCCPPPGGECKNDDNGDGVCTNGIMIDRRYQTCDNVHFSCDNKTVNKYNICHGEALCQDGADLEQCSTLSCDKSTWIDGVPKQTECEDKDTKVSPAHKECYYTAKTDDGQFDCLNRNDEKKVSEERSDRIDFSEVKECQDSDGTDGLYCGTKCWSNFHWCRESGVSTCITESNITFTTVSPQICSNATLWSYVSCDSYYDGRLSTRGVRCSGHNKQCIAPHYSTTSTWSDSDRRCEDKSDQVFPAGTTCSDIAVQLYKSKYCDEFCKLGQEDKKANCKKKCPDPSSWLSEQTDPYILDPHLCQKSCQTPSRDCMACSNEKYLRCLRNNVTVCYHPDLWCDGHSVCDGGVDEPIRNDTCYQKLLKRGAIKPTASFYCQSKMYPEMETVAVVCDGVEECHDGSDEGWKCSNANMMFWGVFGSLALISFIVVLCIRFVSRPPGSDQLPAEWRELSNILDKETFEEQHGSKQFQENMNLLLFINKYLKNENTRIKESEIFHQRELDYHGGNLAEARNSMKSYLDPSVMKIVIEDVEPGIIRRCCPWLEKLWRIRRFRPLTTYLIFFKDFYLMIVILTAIGGLSALFDFPLNVNSITISVMFYTIFIPLTISSILLARDKVYDLEGSVSLFKKVMIYINIILLSIINPLVLIKDVEVNEGIILSHLTNPANTIALDKQQGYSTILRLLKKRQKLEKRYLSFTRSFINLESMYQTLILVVLFLLSSTATGTIVTIPINGVLSIAFSLGTYCYLHVEWVKISKGFFPIKPYLTVLLWAIVSVTKRMMIMVVFFIPSLGLWDLLYHWKYEQAPFTVSIEGKLNATKGDQLFMYTKTPIPWSDIDRWDYTDPKDPILPPYTLYTGIDAGQAFCLFWLTIILHATAILVIKLFTVEKFYKFNALEIVLHCLENCNIPQPWRDWDEGDGTVEEHRTKYRRVRREVVSTMAVNLLFNMVMLVPMIYTVSKIWERHGILERSIGVLPKEIESFDTATKLLTDVLVTFFVLSVLELLIYLAYNIYVHPWKEILTDKIVERVEPEKTPEEESEAPETEKRSSSESVETEQAPEPTEVQQDQALNSEAGKLRGHRRYSESDSESNVGPDVEMRDLSREQEQSPLNDEQSEIDGKISPSYEEEYVTRL